MPGRRPELRGVRGARHDARLGADGDLPLSGPGSLPRALTTIARSMARARAEAPVTTNVGARIPQGARRCDSAGRPRFRPGSETFRRVSGAPPVAARDGGPMTQRTFVTGATGLVGRHLLHRLLARGGHLHVLVRPGDPRGAPRAAGALARGGARPRRGGHGARRRRRRAGARAGSPRPSRSSTSARSTTCSTSPGSTTS